MPEPIWFHDAVWQERQIRFPQIPETWMPIGKLREQSVNEIKKEADKRGRPPFGSAEFLCRSMESTREAYLRIYMQVPYQGTETLPGRLRAQQATLVDLPSNSSDNVEAWRRLITNNVGVTGHLIAEKHSSQVYIDERVLSCLYWDEDAKRLYVHSHFALPTNPYTDNDRLFRPVVLGRFELAMRPYNVRSLKNGPVSVEELEGMGWVF